MPLNTTPNAPHPISLFGGEIPDALTAIEWEESGIEPGEFRDAPPDTPLPASDTLGLFEASWERFHFLKDLATTASGTWRPDAQLTPKTVPLIMATFFGGVAASMYAALSVLHQNEAAKGGYVKIDADRINRLPSRPLEWGWAGLTATPYLFDAALAGAVLSSTPPDQEVLCDLRLPHRRTLVLFGAPYELGTDSGWWTDEDLARAEAGDALKVEVRDALGLPDTGDLFDIGRDSFASLLYRHGGKVHGMLLFSDEHGFVRDQVVWLVETADDHPGGGMNQTIPGRISRSTLEPLVHNVAAAAWGKWQAPDPAQVAKMPTNLDELNKVKNTGNFRRRAQREEAYGVHVIDQRPQSSPAGGATSSGAVVTPHVRRGHWRSVRVAARDAAGRIVGGVHGEHGADWRYEGRWVQPTFVNSHLGQGPRGKVPVYRIPSRDEFTSVAA